MADRGFGHGPELKENGRWGRDLRKIVCLVILNESIEHSS